MQMAQSLCSIQLALGRGFYLIIRVKSLLLPSTLAKTRSWRTSRRVFLKEKKSVHAVEKLQTLVVWKSVIISAVKMYGVVWHLWLTSAPHCLVPTQTHQVREDEIFPSAPKPTSPLACSAAVSSLATLVSLLSRSPRAATSAADSSAQSPAEPP